jgi:hypothetical protein
LAVSVHGQLTDQDGLALVLISSDAVGTHGGLMLIGWTGVALLVMFVCGVVAWALVVG